MTRLVKFANNAVSRLAANISSSTTTLSVTPGDGSKFPTLSGGQYFMATLVKSDGTTEVVKVTARATDTFTVVRAAESVAGASTAYAFSASDKFEMRLTAGALGGELDRIEADSITAQNKSSNYTVTAADVNSLFRTDTSGGAVTITLPQISTLTADFDILVAKVTSDANIVAVNRSGTDTINGAAAYNLTSQYQSVWLIADRSTNTWTAINSGTGGVNSVADSGTGSGINTVTLSGDPGNKNNVAFYVGGVYQQKSTYSISGTTLTAGGNIPSGVAWEAVWSVPLVIGTPADDTVSAAKLQSGAVTYAKLAAEVQGALYGFKNRIINGAMVIDQRNAGASVTPTTGSDVYKLDRWGLYISQSSKLSVQQNAGFVTPPAGFANYLGITTVAAYSVTESDYFLLRQSIEGFNVADLNWGTASAAPVTLSFKVYSSLTGTFGGALQNNAENRGYPFTYTVPVANTWTTISITIAGDTTGNWLKDSSAGIKVNFGLGNGSSYTSPAGAWTSGPSQSANGATSVVGTNGATFYITGVQLEKGSTATSFDYRPYGTELALCQRYYQQLGGTQYQSMGSGVAYSNTLGLGYVKYTTTMRAAPTTSVSNSAGFYAFQGGAIGTSNAINLNYPGVDSCRLDFYEQSNNLAAGYGCFFQTTTSGVYMQLNAEL